jgi:hypothetical protein
MATKITTPEKPKDRVRIVRYIYLYLVTAITIVLILVSTIGCLNIVLRDYVFGVLDYEQVEGPYECQDDVLLYGYDNNGVKYEKFKGLTQEQKDLKKSDCMTKAEARIAKRHVNDVKREFAQYLAMFTIAFPLYLYHWSIIKKENSKQ